MPAYIKSPFKPAPTLMVRGTPSYLWGSWNDKTGDTFGYIISTSGNGVTSTVVFNITQGNVPIVSALSKPLITIVGTQNAGGAYNVVNAPILSIVVTNAGVATVTFLGTGNSASAPDSGQVDIPQPEVAEVLVAAASVPLAMAFVMSQNNQEKDVIAVVSMPTLPTTAIITLQQAEKDQDPEYADVATIASVAGGVLTGGQFSIDQMGGRFYRFNTTNVTGPAASIIAKLSA